jgi:hypothetical protein
MKYFYTLLTLSLSLNAFSNFSPEEIKSFQNDFKQLEETSIDLQYYEASISGSTEKSFGEDITTSDQADLYDEILLSKAGLKKYDTESDILNMESITLESTELPTRARSR